MVHLPAENPSLIAKIKLPETPEGCPGQLGDGFRLTAQ